MPKISSYGILELASNIKISIRHTPIEKMTYLALMAWQLLIVWLLPVFPTQDGPSHIYNASILYDLLHGGKLWGEYFSCNIKAIPNLGFTLIAYPLLSVASPFIVEKIFISIYLLLMVIATHLLIRIFAPSSTYSLTIKLLSIPVIFNFDLMMGFYSYVIAVPFFIISISLLWRVWNKSWTVRFFCNNVAGIVVFFLHLIPFIFYLITFAIISIVEYRNNSETAKSLAGKFLTITPLLALVAYYLSENSTLAVPIDFSYLLSKTRALYLFFHLMTFSTVYFSPWQLLPGSIYMFAILLQLFALVKGYASRKLKFTIEQKVMLLLAVSLIIIYFVFPYSFGEGAYFNERFPWVILLLLLPPLVCVCVDAHLFSTVRIAAATAGILFLCFNTVIFNQQSTKVSIFLEGVAYSCTKSEGIMLYKTMHSGYPRIDVLLHAPSYYCVFNGCMDIGNYAAKSKIFPVQFSRRMPPLPSIGIIQYNPSAIDLSEYPVIKCLLGWKIDMQTRQKLQNTFELLFENDFLSVWHRR
jgi:hypothetical protein